MKRITFRQGASLRLYFLNLKLTWVFVLLCYLLNVFSGILHVTDLSIIVYGVPAAFTELAIHTGFIVWKAKVENCRKHKNVNLLNNLESEVLNNE